MKEFITAVEDVVAADERDEKIAALVAEGKTREEAEAEVEEGDYVEFTLVDISKDPETGEEKRTNRVLRAYPPHDGQLAFMLAALGRGQTQQSRFASIINIMLESLRDEDRDYLEGRLLTRGPDRLGVKTIEAIFEHLTEEWFARPTQ